VVGAIQTFGQLAHWHPPVHALVTEGVFLPESGAFLPLPKLATEPLLKLWEQEVFALLLAEGKITEEVVQNIRSWKHSGFSVDQSVRLEAGDQEGVQRLIQYFLRCPFRQARMIEVTKAGKVIYKSEHNAVGRFPEPGDGELVAGPSRNFQVFDPLDFLAEVTQHIPDAGEHLIIYECSPLLCPRCGSAMKIIAFAKPGGGLEVAVLRRGPSKLGLQTHFPKR
jgi:putative transposase